MNRRKFISTIGSGIATGIFIPVFYPAASQVINNLSDPPGHKKRKMKTVILIGDSIRMAYQPYVKNALAGKVNIIGPEENCEHSGKILENLNKWILDLKPDMVHMNAGLHEIYRNINTGKRKVSIEQYASNLETIFSAIANAKIKMIWSTTTPVVDEWYFKQKGYVCRIDDDVVAYNKVAAGILKKFKIPVLDLYSFCKSKPKESFYYKDGVHFSPEGSLQQGTLISKFILKNL